MINPIESKVTRLIVHRIGSKYHHSGVIKGKNILRCTEKASKLLHRYFLEPFTKVTGVYDFYHSISLDYHPLKGLIDDIVLRDKFRSSSEKIADYLYNQSEHPHIKAGDLFIGEITDLYYEGKKVKAIGVFKTEIKDSFLEVVEHLGVFNVLEKQVIGNRKLDKGFLYLVVPDGDNVILMVDNNSYDTKYWKEDFLGVKEKHSHYQSTSNAIELFKSYVFSCDQEDKITQMNIIHRALDGLSQQDEVDLDSLACYVFPTKETKEAFYVYKEDYEEEKAIAIPNSFRVADAVIAKQRKIHSLKNTLLLDSGIKILLGNTTTDELQGLIEMNYDPNRGLHYYKIYYRSVY